MATLNDYRHFEGRHWETGTVHNYFAFCNFQAPHTGKPYSEALLLGVSGGITLGYFNFSYQGYDPQCNILTRNTFDPWDTMLSRLGVIQHVSHTSIAEKAVTQLENTLEEGVPAILWPDHFSLSYTGNERDDGMWGGMPLLVYGYEPAADVVHIADRAGVGLTVTTGELAAARGRIKKDKHRLITLERPRPEKLPGAVQLGLASTIQLFTEKPPKGSKNSFGLTGLRHWIKMLTNPKQRQSWAKVFPAGRPLYAGLTSAYTFAFLFGKDTALDAERGRYAEFLDEASVILNRPALATAADRFRSSAAAWQRLPEKLLPPHIAPFAEARRLLTARHTLFLEQGGAARTEIMQINAQLKALGHSMETDFPLTAAEVTAHLESVAAELERIHESEANAVQTLAAAVA